MIQAILCSNCFHDQGLRLESFRIGVQEDCLCPNCGTRDGAKLNKELVTELAHHFFVRGTVHRKDYGAAPVLQFNDYHYQKSNVNFPEWLKEDVKTIEEAIKIGVFYYGPRLWMVGEVEPLKSLQDPLQRDAIIQRLLKEYPSRELSVDETFFRLRKDPERPSDQSEYDSPPNALAGRGRLDSTNLSVLYGSQDLEVCIHECRVTVEDELFVATLAPTRELKLLDLTDLIGNDATEFESIDIAVHMLFLAGESSYDISREIGTAAKKSGFDGLIYPSYFSLVRTGSMPFETIYGISIRRFPSFKEYARSQAIPNLALFGRPLEEGRVKVDCINRLILDKISYDVQYGPVGY